jgi:hypothetical protein
MYPKIKYEGGALWLVYPDGRRVEAKTVQHCEDALDAVDPPTASRAESIATVWAVAVAVGILGAVTVAAAILWG